MTTGIAAEQPLVLELDAVWRDWDVVMAELEATPKALKAQRAAIEALVADRAATDAAAAAVASAQRVADTELAELEGRRARARARMDALTAVEQVERTERELVSLGEQIDVVELRLLEGMEAADGHAARAAAIDAALAQARDEEQRAAAAWADRHPVCSAEREALESRRDALEKALHPDVVQRVHLARAQHHRPRGALAWTDAEYYCTCCHRRAPPRWLHEAREATQWHACDGCKRLFHPALAPEPAAQEGPAEE